MTSMLDTRLLLVLSLALSIVSVADAEAPPTIDFDRKVRPILQTRCANFHGSEIRESGLRFLSRVDLFSRNDSGEPAVVANDPGQSALIRRITADESEWERFQKAPKHAEAMIPSANRISGVDLAEQAAYFEIANILLNLDETITKN